MQAGIPFYVACSFLVQETGGGRNVFGHDPTIFSGAGEVTEEKYLAYRAERDATGKYQGVGPMQLTYGPFQDMADQAGGCWKPYVNMLIGFQILAGYRREGDWHYAAKRYNGSESYAVEMDARFAEWKQLLNP
jgi:hypothetical protein